MKKRREKIWLYLWILNKPSESKGLPVCSCVDIDVSEKEEERRQNKNAQRQIKVWMCAGANKALMDTKVVGWMMYGRKKIVVQRDCSKISESSYTYINS